MVSVALPVDHPNTLLSLLPSKFDASAVLRCASMYAGRCSTRTRPVPSSTHKDVAYCSGSWPPGRRWRQPLAGPHETTTRGPLCVVLYLMDASLLPPFPPAESQPHRPRTYKSPVDSPTSASPIPPPADSVLSPGAPLAFATPVPSPPRFPLLDPLSSSSPPADHLSSRTVPGQFGTTQCACMFRVSPPHPIPIQSLVLHAAPTQRWAYGPPDARARACNRAT